MAMSDSPMSVDIGCYWISWKNGERSAWDFRSCLSISRLFKL